jgi:DNA-binding XRE family transcriptional regulator
MHSNPSSIPAIRRRLRSRRLRAALTQQDIAELIGRTSTCVAAAENGGSASSQAVRLVSDAIASVEAGLGAFAPRHVLVDVDQLGTRVAELEGRMASIETAAADKSARLEAAALALSNGKHQTAWVPAA